MKRLAASLVMLSIVVVSIIAASWIRNQTRKERTLGIDPKDSEGLSQFVAQSVIAAANLENVKYEQAINIYSDLLANNPNQTSFARNLAIAHLSKIDVLVSRLADNNFVQAEVRAELGVALEEGIAAADAAIVAQPESEAVYQIAVSVLRHKIRQLPILADELNGELIDRLRGYLKKVPGNAALALAFDETAEEMSSTHPELIKQGLGPLSDASQKYPRNMYLLHRLVERSIELDPPRLEPAFKQLMVLAKPYFSEMAAFSPGTDWEQTGNEILQQLHDNQFQDASYLYQWLSTLKLVSGFNPDYRLVQPNSLSLIDLSDVEAAIKLRAKNFSKSKLALPKVSYAEHSNLNDSQLANVRFAAWYDYDVDLTPEILCLADGKLKICRWDPAAQSPIEVLIELDTMRDATSVFPVDLFVVQFPNASQVDRELRKANLRSKFPQKSDEDINAILSRRHDLLRDCLAYGPSGIEIFASRADSSVPGGIAMSKVDSQTGLETFINVTHVLPCDWDGDGDLDLAVVADGKPHLMQNSGNRTFVDMTQFSDFDLLKSPISAIESCDFDRDIDADFVVTTQARGVGVLENLLHGQFRFRELDGDWKKLSGATSLAVTDLDGNASWDWLGSISDSIAIVMTTTSGVGQVTPTMTFDMPGKSKFVGTADFDNDEQEEIVGWSDSGITLEDAPYGVRQPQAPLKLLSGKSTASLDWADANGDGSLDLLAVADGKLFLLTGKPEESDAFVDFRILGISDSNGGGRVNRLAIGSTLEVFTQGRYQSQIIRRDQTHFGLGQESTYNTRIIFTNGLTQNIVSPKSNTVIEEPQFPKGSCPFLYGWDGEKWCFITDLLWNAPLGLQVAKGKVLQDRRWEYLTIPGEFVQPINGAYEIRITEELWEAAYFDHMSLTAIDHPGDYKIFTNEKVGPPDIAQNRLWSTKNARPIVSATDQTGRSWTEALLHRDGKYVDDIGPHICQGLMEKHYLELDLGTLDRQQPNQLMLTGWIFPTDTSLNIGLDQDPLRPSVEPPSLWVPDEKGDFQNVRPFMGFPGGKPKTIVIDLTDVFLTDDFRVRIETSAEIYWDEAFVVVGENQVDGIVQTPLELASAELRYRGFSQVVMKERSQPHWYDYNNVVTNPAWPPIEGVFTRFGDVTELLTQDDDRIVVMGSGDEMVVRFAMPDQPLPNGWKRDFVLHSTGWDKDCDLNTLQGQSSLPLPFSTMQAYPPPSNQMQRAREVDELNRDQLTRQMNFRSFWKNQISQ